MAYRDDPATGARVDAVQTSARFLKFWCLHEPRAMVKNSISWARANNRVRTNAVHGAEEFKVPTTSRFANRNVQRNTQTVSGEVELQEQYVFVNFFVSCAGWSRDLAEFFGGGWWHATCLKPRFLSRPLQGHMGRPLLLAHETGTPFPCSSRGSVW